MLDAIIDALFPKQKSRITALDQKVDMLLEDLYRRAEGKFAAEGSIADWMVRNRLASPEEMKTLTDCGPSSTKMPSNEFIPVPKFTQGSKKGKVIFCPHCGHSHKVHNFAWTALKCLSCGESTTKYKWLMRRAK